MNESKNSVKRFAAAVLSLVFALISVFSIACSSGGGNNGGFHVKEFVKRDGFSVNYIDVGEGDAIFINFGDGKTMLIDSGEKGRGNFAAIKEYLDAYCNGVLDFFLITHTDSDHAGNAASVAEYIDVKRAFLPDVAFTSGFPDYESAENALKENGAEIIRSAAGRSILGENYILAFLSPNAKGTADSAYDRLNADEFPSSSAINDVSPIVYLEYLGVRFVFTGDAGISQEKAATDNVDAGFIDRFLKRENAVDLNGVDFLKVSHHGAADASGREFLNRLVPAYAIISVGGNNYFGHPATETLTRIYEVNPLCKVLRTSDSGTINVCVSDKGEIAVYTVA